MKKHFTLLRIVHLVTAPALFSFSLSHLTATPDSVEAGTEELTPNEWAGIRRAPREWKHSFVENGNGTFTAANPRQQWKTSFDERGFLAEPKGQNWRWGLELIGYGVGIERKEVNSKAKAEAEGTRLSYRRDEVLEE